MDFPIISGLKRREFIEFLEQDGYRVKLYTGKNNRGPAIEQ